MSIPNLLPLIERERAKFPDALLNAEQVGQLMYNIARAAGPDWGLLLKPHGHGVPSPIGRISQDVLVHIPEEQEYDALESADGKNGAPGPARPRFDKLPFKVGKCWTNPDTGEVKCSGASMVNVRPALPLPTDDEEGDVNDAPQTPRPIPPPPVVPAAPASPAHPYPDHTALGGALGAAFMDGYGTEMLHWSLVGPVGEIVAHLLWRYQFEGASRDVLIADARARGAGAR